MNVRAAESGQPLSAAEIQVKARKGNGLSGLTAEDGQSLFEGLAPGLVEVTATVQGRQPAQEPTVRLIDGRVTLVTFDLAKSNAPDAPLEEVVVVARAQSANAFSGVTGTLRNRDELRNAVGAGSDVMRALDGLPGLQSDGEFANFTVRGRGPRNNLILVDDFPLDKVVHFDESIGADEDAAGGGRFSIFAPNSVSSAEFSPGGWGAAYGGRAGSLLRLQLAEGGQTPVTSLRLDLAGLELTYDGPSGIDEDTSVFFTARQFDFGNVFDIIGEEDIGSPEITDIILKTATDLSNGDTLEFLFIQADEEFARDVDNVLESDDFEDTSIERSEQDLTLLGLTWRKQLSNGGEWINRAYLRTSDKFTGEGEAFPDAVPDVRNANLIPFEADILTVEEDETELGWRSDYSQPNRLGFFGAGVRVVNYDAEVVTKLQRPWVRYVYETDDPRPPGQDFIIWLPEQINANYDENVTSYSGYVQQSFDLLGAEWRAGLRVDYDGFSEHTYTSPHLAGLYTVSDALELSVNAGVYYEVPRLLTRASSASNFELDLEQTRHFSVGAKYQINRDWRLLAEIYHQELDDLVVDESRANAQANNDGDGSNSGFDIVLQRSFGDRWTADLTYFYNRARRNDNDGRGSYRPDFSREHFLAVGGVWEITDQLQVAARWKFGSGRPGDEFIVNDDVLPAGNLVRASKEITRENATDLTDYQSLNIRVDYRQRLWGVDVVTFLDIVNVYSADIGAPLDFNPRNGREVDEDSSFFPQIGLIFEKAW
ncbi:MAG: TonB-dependent receptor [Pseudomonadota bacterium]